MKLTDNDNRNQSLQKEFNRLFEEFWIPEYNSEEYNIRPSIEAAEYENHYTLKVELPGLKKEEIDIQLKEDSVLISGELKRPLDYEENVFRSEFMYGKFSREVGFYEMLDIKKATADYKDGILFLTLPKLDNKEEKTIKLPL